MRIPFTFVLLCLIWGSTWSVIAIGLKGIPPFTGVAIRFAIAAVILFLLARVRGVRFGRGRHEVGLWWINALLAFAGSYGIVYWVEQYVPSGLTAILFATYPLFVALLSHFVLPGERLQWISTFGTVVGFAGVAVIFSSDFSQLGGPQVAVAALVMMISPFISAISSVAVKKYGSGVHPFSLTSVPMAMTAGIMGALALGYEREREIVFDAVSVSALLYLAIVGSAVSFSLYYWLLARIPATKAALIAYVVPVIAVIVGMVFLDEPVTPQSVIGSLLVIGGVMLTVKQRR